MTGPVILDTGPLVAFLSRRERHHRWAEARFDEVRPPLLTCEAVLTEAFYLLRNVPDGHRAVLGLMSRGVVSIRFRLDESLGPVEGLLRRYADVPMSLADACLVRMAELHEGSRVFTLDSDFSMYRGHGRSSIPTLMPEVL